MLEILFIGAVSLYAAWKLLDWLLCKFIVGQYK